MINHNDLIFQICMKESNDTLGKFLIREKHYYIIQNSKRLILHNPSTGQKFLSFLSCEKNNIIYTTGKVANAK